ncbi:hypothetical protein [Paraburkholderia sp. J67]|uniref:hypothetical protein n=1 Tax=Paraburkholderia sp. J67 TaxID=2805435 RepID=UPI002ABD6C11|nr:hypothetical protein [Paraburkholderia sp. J67]
MVSTVTSQLASTIVTVTLCACATSMSTSAWAQGNALAPGMNTGKQVQKISRNDRKPQPVAKATRPAPQSLRYLMSDAP